MTLLLPWLALSDQRRLFPDGLVFSSPDAQETWVRSLSHVRLFVALNSLKRLRCLLMRGLTVKQVGDLSENTQTGNPSSLCPLLASRPCSINRHGRIAHRCGRGYASALALMLRLNSRGIRGAMTTHSAPYSLSAMSRSTCLTARRAARSLNVFQCEALL